MENFTLAWQLFQQMEEACYISDPLTSEILYVNDAFESLYGYSGTALNGLRIIDLNLHIRKFAHLHIFLNLCGVKTFSYSL